MQEVYTEMLKLYVTILISECKVDLCACQQFTVSSLITLGVLCLILFLIKIYFSLAGGIVC